MKAGDLRHIIDVILKTEGTTLSKICEVVGIDRTYLSKLINGDKQKELTTSIVRKFESNYNEYITGDYKNNKADLDEKQHPVPKQVGFKKVAFTEKDDYLSGENLSKFATAHLKTIEMNQELMRVIVGVHKETRSTPLDDGLKKLLLEIASGKKQMTIQQLAALIEQSLAQGNESR